MTKVEALNKLSPKKLKVNKTNRAQMLCWMEGKKSQVKYGDMKEVLFNIEVLEAFLRVSGSKDSVIRTLRQGAKRQEAVMRSLIDKAKRRARK